MPLFVRLAALAAAVIVVAVGVSLVVLDPFLGLAVLVTNGDATAFVLAGVACLAFAVVWVGLAAWTFDLIDRARRELEAEPPVDLDAERERRRRQRDRRRSSDDGFARFVADIGLDPFGDSRQS